MRSGSRSKAGLTLLAALGAMPLMLPTSNAHADVPGVPIPPVTIQYGIGTDAPVTYGGCSYEANKQSSVTNGAFVGVIGDKSATATSATPPAMLAGSVTCKLVVNGVDAPSTSFTYADALGQKGTQSGANPISYTASPFSSIQLCQRSSYTDMGVTTAWRCTDQISQILPPEAVVTTIQQGLDILDQELTGAPAVDLQAVSSASPSGVGYVNPPVGLADPGGLRVTGADAWGGDPAAMGSGAGGTGGSCDPDGHVDYTYTPKNAYFEETRTPGLKGAYTTVAYQRNNTYRDGATHEVMYEVALCAFGGARTDRDHRLLHEGISVSLKADADPSARNMLGSGWDTNVDDAASSTTVDFAVDAGPASVSVSTGTTGTGQNKGDEGITPPYGANNASAMNEKNVVDGYWEESHSWWTPYYYIGSEDYQGSVAEGLYRLGMKTQPAWHYTMGIYAAYHCKGTHAALCDPQADGLVMGFEPGPFL